MRIVKQVRATFGDALWADFVTHANARYIDTILRPFRRPDRLTPRYVYATPIRSLAQLLYKSEYISQCNAPCGHGHLDLRVVHGEQLRISLFLPDAVKVHRPERVGVPMAGCG